MWWHSQWSQRSYKLRQEDHMFMLSLGNLVISYLEIKNKNKKKIWDTVGSVRRSWVQSEVPQTNKQTTNKKEMANLSSKETVLFCISTNNEWEFLLL